MAQRDNRESTRLGDLLKQQGLLQHHELRSALSVQQSSGESLGHILLRSGAIGRRDLAKTLLRQRALRLAALTGSLMIAPMAVWADSSYQNGGYASSHYEMPTADRPAIYDGAPISVPVKALVERLTVRMRSSTNEVKRFRYDIDTLGHGMAVRLHYKF